MPDISSLDLRWVAATSYIIIGLFLIFLAVRVWFMPLSRRAIVFAPYLTAEGLRFLLRAVPMAFAAGLLFIASGTSKWAYYARWQGSVADEYANAVGLIEAIFSAWAAISLLIVGSRPWRKK